MVVHLPVLRVYLHQVLGADSLEFRLLRPVMTPTLFQYPSWRLFYDGLGEPVLYTVRFTGVLDVDHDYRHPVLDCYRAFSGDMEASFAFRCTSEQLRSLYQFCLLEDLSSAVLALRLTPDSSGGVNLESMEVWHANCRVVSR